MMPAFSYFPRTVPSFLYCRALQNSLSNPKKPPLCNPGGLITAHPRPAVPAGKMGRAKSAHGFLLAEFDPHDLA